MSVSVRRRKFMVVVDETPEARVAMHYAARRAEHTGGIVTLVHVLDQPDMQQWKGVEERMREEAQAEAEATLYEAAKYVFDLSSVYSELVVIEGKKRDALIAFLASDPAVAILVLGSGSGREGPGQLVTAAASAGFPIPVTIVPGALTPKAIDAIA